MRPARITKARLQSLRRLRDSLMTQEDLAREVGVSLGTIRNFEQGRNIPRQFDKIVAVLRAARARELGIMTADQLAEMSGLPPAVAQRIVDAEPISDVLGEAADIILDVEEARYREAAKPGAILAHSERLAGRDVVERRRGTA